MSINNFFTIRASQLMKISHELVLIASKNQVSTTLTPDPTEGIVILSLKDGIYYELKEVDKLSDKPY